MEPATNTNKLAADASPNIKEAVPFFRVSDMERSLRFYLNGLGFTIVNQWVPRGKIEWCRIERDGVGLMLQEPRKDDHHAAGVPAGKLGTGVSICFTCEDTLAVYHEVISRGIAATEPFVGNWMWVTFLEDPDGYRLEFHSSTDVPEETRYSDWKNR